MKETNFIVASKKVTDKVQAEYFGDEDVVFVTKKADMHDLLVMAGIYESKEEAISKWNRSGKEIPKGLNDYRKIEGDNRITILNLP